MNPPMCQAQGGNYNSEKVNRVFALGRVHSSKGDRWTIQIKLL